MITLRLHYYSVIVSLLSTLQPIQCSMSAQNTEIDCHVVTDKMIQGVIRLLHIRTQSQLANLLTKALSAHQFHNLLSKMNMLNVHSPLHLEGECKDSKSRSVAKSVRSKSKKKKKLSEDRIEESNET